MRIEPWPYLVISVKDMHQLSVGPVNARFKIPKATYIFWLAEITNPAFANRANHFFHINIGAAIIHHFNLHVRFA